MKLAAIDIGSNAVRLLISNVFDNGNGLQFKKEELYRIPVRLGADAFGTNKIPKKKAKALLKAMKAFKNLLDIHKPMAYTACATSAMREAINGKKIVSKIKRQTGIKINIIDGKREATVIQNGHIQEISNLKQTFLFIDVGGGSTEITLYSDDEVIASNSFRIGTVRMLENLVEDKEWEELEKWLKTNVKQYKSISGIGTGGNINFLHKLSRKNFILRFFKKQYFFKLFNKKADKPLTYRKINSIYKFLRSYSLQDRIKYLGIRPDRAEVIIPASQIFLNIMKWANVSDIYVYNLGLADGLLRELYQNYKDKFPIH